MIGNIVLLGLGCFAHASALQHHRRETTLIPSDSFSSLDTYWDYGYPWGTDHNGAARMDEGHVQVEDGTLILTAEPAEGEPPASHGGKDIPIHYLSGAVHTKDTLAVKKGGGYDFSGEFLASTAVGTWPAFWLNGANSWPPEIDIAEWKGSGDITFNTFNSSSELTGLDVPYSNEGEWHSVTCEIRDVNGEDISARFTLDGEEVAVQYGGGYVDEPMHL
ncbi:family 16 glycosylhydrolase [Candidatus Bathyarchaeota archaeon]|nr:family 16 glycosylhydrolase [Candidatus Bathyarchaeota archaeon]